LAKEKKAELVTGDPEFKPLAKEITVSWLKGPGNVFQHPTRRSVGILCPNGLLVTDLIAKRM
jgi:hypothetical protein